MLASRPAVPAHPPPTSPRATPSILRHGLAILALGLGTAAHAQQPLMVDGLIAHRVAPGDTLEQIARDYLGDHRLWRELQAFNRVANPLLLQPGFTLRFPEKLLQMATASIEFVQGRAVAITPARRSADSRELPAQRRDLQAGEVLQEGDQLQLDPNAFVAVRLADGSLVRVEAQSDVHLQQMRRRGRAGSLQSVLELQSGGLDASVTPEPANPRRFEIRTRVASTSVRGTRFSVQADANGRTIAAVDEGAVAVAATGAADSRRRGAVPAPVLTAGHGMAIAADGRQGQSSALLAAPDVAALPERFEDTHWLDIALPAVASASRYQWQVARDAQFSQVVRSTTSDSPLVRMAAVEDGDYLLAVRAIDAQGIPGRLAQRSIRVKTQPVPPLYQAPAAAGIVAQGAGTLQCTSVPGAVAYRIQVAGDAGFSQPLLDARHGECQLSVAALPVGAYQWRAASIRSTAAHDADQGPFAAGQAFSVATPPPALPASDLDLGSPGDTAQLSWPGQPGQSYRLQVASDLEFHDVLHDAVLDAPRWSASTLAPGSYYVKLQIIDANGLRSRFSAAREFAAGSTVLDGSGQRLRSGAGLSVHRP